MSEVALSSLKSPGVRPVRTRSMHRLLPKELSNRQTNEPSSTKRTPASTLRKIGAWQHTKGVHHVPLTWPSKLEIRSGLLLVIYQCRWRMQRQAGAVHPTEHGTWNPSLVSCMGPAVRSLTRLDQKLEQRHMHIACNQDEV